MAKTHQPAFVQSNRAETAIVTGASTDHTDPSNSVLLWTPGPEGSTITGIWAVPRDTVTASGLQLYLSTDGGTTQILIDSAVMAAHTVAATTAIPRTEFDRYAEDTPLYLPSGTALYAGSAVALADGIVFTAIGGDL